MAPMGIWPSDRGCGWGGIMTIAIDMKPHTGFMNERGGGVCY